MSKYSVCVPLVGYSYVEVEADNEDDAKSKAMDLCCDFDNSNVEVQELYGVEHVAQGNCVNHPYWDIEVEESES